MEPFSWHTRLWPSHSDALKHTAIHRRDKMKMRGENKKYSMIYLLCTELNSLEYRDAPVSISMQPALIYASPICIPCLPSVGIHTHTACSPCHSDASKFCVYSVVWSEDRNHGPQLINKYIDRNRMEIIKTNKIKKKKKRTKRSFSVLVCSYRCM